MNYGAFEISILLTMALCEAIGTDDKYKPLGLEFEDEYEEDGETLTGRTFLEFTITIDFIQGLEDFGQELRNQANMIDLFKEMTKEYSIPDEDIEINTDFD